MKRTSVTPGYSAKHGLILGLASVVCILSTVLARGQATPFGSVDPFIGTANGGNTFPGAALPFGMIQWSPDTGEGWYYYGDSRIHGFSLTHLSGAGCPVFADMPILPWSDPPADDRVNGKPESLGFSHTGESAHPGYYAVTLSDGTAVELAVTERAGMARLRFAPGRHAGLLLNSAGSASSDVHMAKLPPVGREHDRESLALQPDGSMRGTVTAGGFCGSPTRYTLHLALHAMGGPKRTLLWQDGHAVSAKTATCKRAVAWLDLGTGSEHLVKVGLSYVSEAKAEANLQAELPGWNFDEARRSAEVSWSKALSAIEISGASRADRTIFYTAMYHNLLHPNLISDGDGEYAGFDGRIHHVANEQAAQYANFSDWDIYRNTTPLQALLEPKRASDMAQSLVNDAEQMGSLPRWAIATDSSYVMGGDAPSILLPELYSFGARAFDTRKALAIMMRGATVPGLGVHGGEERVHLADYLRLGYLPVSSTKLAPWDISASETLEVTNADFAIGAMARSLGDGVSAAAMFKRAGNWRNLLDPETHWIRPRGADGNWLAGFDAEKSLPHAVDAPVPTDQFGFQEGNTYQYSFMLPFDYAGLFAAMGGDAVVEPRLDKFFAKLVCWGEPCFNMANEPDFVTPYAYTFLGKPWKTAAVVRRIEKETFNTTPGGLAGNDDLGATSGVYLWNALGMYPAIPGLGGVVLGAPRFAAATMHLPQSKILSIERRGSGESVQRVTLNGKSYSSSWLPLDRLQRGRNRLVFTMSTHEGAPWATQLADRPPSLSR